MTRFIWKSLKCLLPGLLLILQCIVASPVLSHNEDSTNPELVFRDETDLIKLEDPVAKAFSVFYEYANNSYHPTTDYSTFPLTTVDQFTQVSEFDSNTTNIRERQDARKSLNKLFPKQQWGSHPIGTREAFAQSSASGKYKWMAYFYDQAVATVLLDENKAMMKCTVQENIEPWEQEAALAYLGSIMPLVPLDFNNMVHLITVCGSMNIPIQPYSPEAESNMSWWNGLSALQGILPGTLWCGMRDKATFYNELGPRQKVDNCCRSHDLCPIKVIGWNTRYRVANMNFRALLHCACDLEFYRCLKAAQTQTADIVGQIYFNYLKVQCLDAPVTRTPKMVYHWPNPEEPVPLPSALLMPADISRRSLDQDAADSGSGVPDQRSPETGKDLELKNRYDNGKDLEQKNRYDTDKDLEPKNRNDAGRLDCVRVDNEGGCRKWVLSPKGFRVHLISRSLDVVY